MSRITKSSNSPGKEYFENAAKMIPWGITVEPWKDGQINKEIRSINVPASEWDLARENLTVMHLAGQHGFVIQDTIVCEKKTVYNPEIKLKYARPIKQDKPQEGFKVGDRFRVKSTNTALEVISNINGIELKYVDGSKTPIKTTIEQIEIQLNRQTWIRI